MNATRLEQLAREGFTRVPVVRRLLADLDTPLGAYLKFAGPFSFLFESVEGGEKWGRYSIIGLPCRRRIVVRGRAHQLCDGDVEQDVAHADPLAFVEEFRRARARVPARGPADVRGRAGRLFRLRLRAHRRAATRRERAARRARHARHPADGRRGSAGLRQPGRRHRAGRHGRPARADAAAGAEARLDALQRRLGGRRRGCRRWTSMPAGATASACATRGGVRVGIRPSAFRGGGGADPRVHPRRRRDAGGALAADERFRSSASPLNLYRALRNLNPSPYMYFLDLGDFQIVGSSPEILARLEDGAGHGAPDRRHAPARRTRGGGPGAGSRSCWPTRRKSPST